VTIQPELFLDIYLFIYLFIAIVKNLLVSEMQKEIKK